LQLPTTQSKALGSLSGRADGNTCLAACRHLGENKFYESKALFDLTNANPYSRVNVALREHRNVEIVKKGVIRRVGEVKAGVKGAAPGRPADIAATGILLREGWREDPCPDRAVLQGRGVVVKLDQRRKGLADGGDQCTNLLVGIRGQIDVNPARHDAVHHQPVPETGGGSAAKPAPRKTPNKRRR
jgi:hypothetical protein